MPSIYEIHWTSEANRNLIEIENFILLKWNVKIAKTFFKKLDSRIEIISKRPFAFPAAKHSESLRRCVITKQTTIYYLVKSNRIDIVSVFDTRRNPNKLPK